MKYPLPIIAILALLIGPAFGQLPSKNQVLWLDASDADTLSIEDDGTISKWADKSGANSNAVQVVAERRPVISEGNRGPKRHPPGCHHRHEDRESQPGAPLLRLYR